jgi:hypothetical protein
VDTRRATEGPAGVLDREKGTFLFSALLIPARVKAEFAKELAGEAGPLAAVL